ncbi:MAG: sigma-70 family RNA polymerase sigma factor [Planctomycetota bacterium]
MSLAQSVETPHTSPAEPPHVVAAWERYRSHRDTAALEILVAHYEPLVRKCARRLAKRLPDTVDIGDLIGAGHLGLLIAIERYRSDRSTSFATFSGSHIHGAMIDETRRQDHLPRSRRNRLKRFEDVVERFKQTHHRPPTQKEAAQMFDGPPPVAPRMVHFDAGTEDQPTGPLEPTDDREPSPLRAAYRNLIIESLNTGLSKRERLILLLHTHEGMSMAEIGLAIGISESRVSQLRKSVMARLQDRFGKDGHRLVA